VRKHLKILLLGSLATFATLLYVNNHALTKREYCEHAIATACGKSYLAEVSQRGWPLPMMWSVSECTDIKGGYCDFLDEDLKNSPISSSFAFAPDFMGINMFINIAIWTTIVGITSYTLNRTLRREHEQKHPKSS